MFGVVENSPAPAGPQAGEDWSYWVVSHIGRGSPLEEGESAFDAALSVEQALGVVRRVLEEMGARAGPSKRARGYSAAG